MINITPLLFVAAPVAALYFISAATAAEVEGAPKKPLIEIGASGYGPIDKASDSSGFSWDNAGGNLFINVFDGYEREAILSPVAPFDLKRFYGMPMFFMTAFGNSYNEGKWRLNSGTNMSRSLTSGGVSAGTWRERNMFSGFFKIISAENNYEGATSSIYKWDAWQVGGNYAHQIRLFAPSGGRDFDTGATDLRLGGGVSYYSSPSWGWQETETSLSADLMIGMQSFWGKFIPEYTSGASYLPTHLRFTNMFGIKALPTSAPMYFKSSVAAYIDLTGVSPDSMNKFFKSGRFGAWYFSYHPDNERKELYPEFEANGFSRFFGGITIFEDAANNIEFMFEKEFRRVDGYGSHSVTTMTVRYSLLY